MQQLSFLYVDFTINMEFVMCVIPAFHDENIYFYSDEYGVCWRDIVEVGDPNKQITLNSRTKVRPATYREIYEKNLFQHIISIKVCEKHGGEVNIFHITLQDKN